MDLALAARREDRELMLLEDLQTVARQDEVWSVFIDTHVHGSGDEIGIHLAIVLEPYLEFILDGSKSVESRFSRNGCAPFGRVVAGDIVLLKRSSGPVVGLCTVSDVWDYRLTPSTLNDIRTRFGPAICAQDGFWEARGDAVFATLMRIEGAIPLPDLVVPKRDRRGWVVLRDHRVPELL
jgi:hypothetical protein